MDKNSISLSGGEIKLKSYKKPKQEPAFSADEKAKDTKAKNDKNKDGLSQVKTTSYLKEEKTTFRPSNASWLEAGAGKTNTLREEEAKRLGKNLIDIYETYNKPNVVDTFAPNKYGISITDYKTVSEHLKDGSQINSSHDFKKFLQILDVGREKLGPQTGESHQTFRNDLKTGGLFGGIPNAIHEIEKENPGTLIAQQSKGIGQKSIFIFDMGNHIKAYDSKGEALTYEEFTDFDIANKHLDPQIFSETANDEKFKAPGTNPDEKPEPIKRKIPDGLDPQFKRTDKPSQQKLV